MSSAYVNGFDYFGYERSQGARFDCVGLTGIYLYVLRRAAP